MNDAEIKTRILEILGNIAPEADLARIDPDKNFRDQIDLDSMDYLNFVIALDENFQAEIPEQDYTKFITLNDCVRELKVSLERLQSDRSREAAGKEAINFP